MVNAILVFLVSISTCSHYLTILMHLFWQVDMTALIHMTDEDLKAMGIPMVNS